ncbi:MAG: DUF1134 domain-containing protein [Chitinophagales bacterium]|nr:DUF1134 domain-containing protein [Hyphomicrobiales bacterium]
MRATLSIVAFAAIHLAASLPAFAQAKVCTARDLASTFDDAASTLRNLNTDSEKRFMAKIRAAGQQRGWTETQILAKADAQLDDPKLDEFNSQIEVNVGRMDDLSRISGAAVSCDRLDELRRTRDQLLTVMGQKSGYMIAELDAKLARDDTDAKSGQSRAETRPEPKPDSSATAWRLDPPRPQPVEPNAPTRLTPSPEPYLPPLQNTNPADRAEPQDYPPLADLPPPPDIGYNIADIREAGKGVFGTLSSELAAVINYAFKSYGYPNAYIVGSEGGGALLAGLRWGKGKLNLKDREPQRIHWRGPSLGLDFGASGSNVMLLVYNLSDAGAMYESFTGVEGSAYVVGGVGLNVLKHGDIIIVPIRTGLGLRVGANVGYLKFTDKSSWNPF